RLTMEREILKNYGLLCGAPEARCAFIREHREQFSISVMCGVLGFSRSGYHHCIRRIQSGRSVDSDRLGLAIMRIFNSNR
ncbi:MAG: hypothetical protein NTX25_23510, partial [Proteobacteria bacterium]|nr:hypothetical protein [Pseudomonadota bacterium]